MLVWMSVLFVRVRAQWGGWLLALPLACLLGCEGPRTGTPGLDPPHPTLDGGAAPGNSGAGSGSAQAAGSAAVAGSAGAGGRGSQAGSGDSEVMPHPDAGSAEPNADDAGAEEDGGTEDTGPGSELFEGLWVVDQPSHALYEATQYELAPGGVLREGDTLGGPTEDYATGTVGMGDLSCRFARHWRTLEARVLELDSDCSDGTPRTVVLAFPDGDESTGLRPTVKTVAGEAGWDHLGFDWAWRKCATDGECPPF